MGAENSSRPSLSLARPICRVKAGEDSLFSAEARRSWHRWTPKAALTSSLAEEKSVVPERRWRSRRAMRMREASIPSASACCAGGDAMARAREASESGAGEEGALLPMPAAVLEVVVPAVEAEELEDWKSTNRSFFERGSRKHV